MYMSATHSELEVQAETHFVMKLGQRDIEGSWLLSANDRCSLRHVCMPHPS